MTKVFVALGGAECVWRDLSGVYDLPLSVADMTFGAVNDIGSAFAGPLSIWASLHPEKFQAWQDQRLKAGHNTDYVAVSHKRFANARVDRVIPELWSGSSGLYLVQAAIKTFGFDRVIVCGMPIDDRPHYNRRGKEWGSSRVYRRGWERKASGDPAFMPNVRSMSGWTQEFLGAPSVDWLAMPATSDLRGDALSTCGK